MPKKVEKQKNKVWLIALIAAISGLLTNVDRIYETLNKYLIKIQPLDQTVSITYPDLPDIDYGLDITLNNKSNRNLVFKSAVLKVDTVLALSKEALLSDVFKADTLKKMYYMAQGNSGAIHVSETYELPSEQIKRGENVFVLNQWIKANSIDRFVMNIKRNYGQDGLLFLKVSTSLCEINNDCHKIMDNKLVVSGNLKMKGLINATSNSLIPDSLRNQIPKMNREYKGEIDDWFDGYWSNHMKKSKDSLADPSEEEIDKILRENTINP